MHIPLPSRPNIVDVPAILEAPYSKRLLNVTPMRHFFLIHRHHSWFTQPILPRCGRRPTLISAKFQLSNPDFPTSVALSAFGNYDSKSFLDLCGDLGVELEAEVNSQSVGY